MKLSIAVVTMNREGQLIEALQSCIDCILPKDTEFVIVDNASTDYTGEGVKLFFDKNKYSYSYYRLKENIGCGNGRNYAYLKSNGDYVYFLDDDAYISVLNNKDFFIRAIEFLDENPLVKTLTTQIYDNAWKRNRVDKRGPKISDGLYKVYMFCGGSHFLKRDFFEDAEPYYANRYGYEEIFPSLLVYNSGYINAFAADLLIVHNPLVNKWKENSEMGIGLTATGLVQTFLMRSALFPIVLTPLNLLAFFIRLFNRKSLRLFVASIKMLRKTRIDRGNRKRLCLITVKQLFQDFSYSIF